MLSDWFRQSIEGMHPDYPDGKNSFHGTARSLTGLTTNPLSTYYGLPTPLHWEIAFDPISGNSRLLNVADEHPVPILAWQGNQGQFVYLDAQGDAHDTWPPPLGQWPQLPSAIRLELTRDGAPETIMAVPMGPTTLLTRTRDVESILGVQR